MLKIVRGGTLHNGDSSGASVGPSRPSHVPATWIKNYPAWSTYKQSTERSAADGQEADKEVFFIFTYLGRFPEITFPYMRVYKARVFEGRR